MRREIIDVVRYPSGCCPSHDTFPNETHKSNRSKRARSRDKKIEHRYVRRVKDQAIMKELLD